MIFFLCNHWILNTIRISKFSESSQHSTVVTTFQWKKPTLSVNIPEKWSALVARVVANPMASRSASISLFTSGTTISAKIKPPPQFMVRPEQIKSFRPSRKGVHCQTKPCGSSLAEAGASTSIVSEEEAGFRGASRSMGLAASAVLSAKFVWPVRLVCKSTSCTQTQTPRGIINHRTHTSYAIGTGSRTPRGAPDWITKSDGAEPGRAAEGGRSYGLGPAWLAAVGADEVEDGLGGLDEVGVVRGLGVRLRLLHAPQLRAAVAAPQRQPRHCRPRSARIGLVRAPRRKSRFGAEQQRRKCALSSLLARFLLVGREDGETRRWPERITMGWIRIGMQCQGT